MAKHLTTNTLIDSVKRRGMIPQNQNTFSEADFIALANEEMDIGIIPHILSYHEDYLLQEAYVNITPEISEVAIPYRATGNKIREVSYVDSSGNVFEMTRVVVEDLPYYQNGSYGISNAGVRAFYIEGDEIVILPVGRHNLSGQIKISYYLRPNSLVSESEVSVITAINKYTGKITVDKVPNSLSSPIEMDFLQFRSPHKRLAINITPSSVSKPDKYYQFGTSSIYNITTQPKSSINSSSYFTFIATKLNILYVVWYNKTGTDTQPSVSGASNYIEVNISAITSADDVATLTSTAINASLLSNISSSSASNVLTITTDLIGSYSSIAMNNVPFSFSLLQQGTDPLPQGLMLGDHLAAVEECIIPNIPDDLHSMLAQRVVCRCLEALGDQNGLGAANQKLAEMELKTGQLIDNRVEGAPLKVVNRHGFLRQSRRMLRR